MRPNLINAYTLSDGAYDEVVALTPDGKWKPCRPVSAPTFRERVKLAWHVFTGRYDALVWPGQGDGA